MPKSAILLKLKTEQKCTHMFCPFPHGSQRVVELLATLLLLHYLCIPYYSHHAFRVLRLLRGFGPYIWPQTPFPSQNNINNNFFNIFIQTKSNRCWVFDPGVTTIYTSWQVARNKDFGKQRWDSRNVRGICEKVRCSWVGSKTLPLIGARLSF